MLIAQAKQEAALQLEQQALREREEEKRRKKQERTKLQLQAYHNEQEARRAEERVWLEGLKEESETIRRAEATRGHGRVKYRRKQLLDKLTQQKVVLEQRAEEEREKEERLATLRQQVRYSDRTGTVPASTKKI